MRGRCTAAALVLLSAAAHAAPTAYTSKAAFDAAIAAYDTVASVDFESVAAGTVIPDGGLLGGIEFEYVIDGSQQLVVIDDFAATSGTRSLGTSTDRVFLAGDQFSLHFAPATAIGIYVIGEDMIPGDVELQTVAGTVANGAPDATLSDGSEAFFLGIVESDPLLAFDFATVRSFIPDEVGDFVWNADDIEIAVAPEPDAAATAAAAGFALAVLRRVRRST
jgi:hypothetical protein